MIKKIALLFLLVLISGFSFSQSDDFGIWLGVNAKHELFKKLDINLSGCIRTYNNTSQVEQSFLEGGVQYNIKKHLSISGYYRFISKLEDNSKYYNRHKLFVDIKGVLPAGRFSFSARARLQRKTKTFIEDDEDLISKYLTRLKLKATYNISSFPLKPYVYYEPFVPVFNDSKFKISKQRFSAGAELKINSKNSIELEYIFQRDFQPHISNKHIISLNYQIKF